MKNKKRKVTTRYAKSEFDFIGLVLLLYALCVAYVPFALLQYANATPAAHPNLNSSLIRVAYLYLIVTLGTYIPFTILKIHCKIKSTGEYVQIHIGL